MHVGNTGTVSAVTLADAFSIGMLDAHAQAALLQRREVTATELAQAALLRIERLNPVLNAVSCIDRDGALNRSRHSPGGPMSGVPYLLKDSLPYAGMPNRSGSRAIGPSSYQGETFPYSQRLDQAGLNPVGKTTAPEFSLLCTTESALYGATRNPWDLAQTAGGSSGGAAAAVASGMVPVAHGGDGGGSIRIPAACCGVFGFKASRGGNVRARAPHPIEDWLVSDGLLSRSVRDAAWAWAQTHPARPAMPAPTAMPERLRIGFVMRNARGELPTDDVQRAARHAALVCEAMGHHVELACLPPEAEVLHADFIRLWFVLGREICTQFGEALDRLEPFTRYLGASVNATGGICVKHCVELAEQAFARFFDRYDVLLCPVLPSAPFPLGWIGPAQPPEVTEQRLFALASYTLLQNLAGMPSMSVPVLGAAGGLPVGVMFSAAPGQDLRLFELAYAWEQAAPWSASWPVHSVATGVGD